MSLKKEASCISCTQVTPGSEGTVTSLELRLAPTLCLKNVDIEGDPDGFYENRQCPENVSNRRIICTITGWDRPWIEDTLYSEPTCHEDTHSNRTGEVKHTSEDVREVSLVFNYVGSFILSTTLAAGRPNNEWLMGS